MIRVDDLDVWVLVGGHCFDVHSIVVLSIRIHGEEVFCADH